MDKNYVKLFKKIESISPPQELYGRVLSRITLAEKKLARKKLVFLSSLALATLSSLGAMFYYIAQGLGRSGFYQYLSLIFSDGVTILSYWKELALSLVESLPLFEVAISLVLIVALLESVKLIIKNIKSAFLAV